MPYLLREARLEDAPVLADLSDELGYPSDAAAVARRLRDLATQPGNAVLVAVSGEGEVAGWVHVFATHRVESDGFAEIGGLVVRETLRGEGIGRMLVEAAEAWAREAGFVEVRVRSNVVREATHRFYDHLGYATTKQQQVFTKSIEVRGMGQRV